MGQGSLSTPATTAELDIFDSIRRDLRSTSYCTVIAALPKHYFLDAVAQQAEKMNEMYAPLRFVTKTMAKRVFEVKVREYSLGGWYEHNFAEIFGRSMKMDEMMEVAHKYGTDTCTPEDEMVKAFDAAAGPGPSEAMINPETCTETGGMQYNEILLLMKQQLSSTDPDSIIYFFIPKQELLDMQGALPCFQILAREGKLRGFRMDMSAAVRGKYRRKFIIISHRWAARGEPDPKGEQFAKIQDMARLDDSAEFFWIDFASMPQTWKCNSELPIVFGEGGLMYMQEEHCRYTLGKKCDFNSRYFNMAIKKVNILYLGGDVWVLLDTDYFRRFWCALESFLAFSDATSHGLVRSDRHIKVGCVGLGDKSKKNQRIFEEFLRCIVYDVSSTSEMLENLKGDEFIVTTQSDKDLQIQVLGELEEATKRICARET